MCRCSSVPRRCGTLRCKAMVAKAKSKRALIWRGLEARFEWSKMPSRAAWCGERGADGSASTEGKFSPRRFAHVLWSKDNIGGCSWTDGKTRLIVDGSQFGHSSALATRGGKLNTMQMQGGQFDRVCPPHCGGPQKVDGGDVPALISPRPAGRMRDRGGSGTMRSRC